MFMQQLPKPAPGAWVAVDEWERMRTSAPLKTPALYMTVFAAGDASSSAGVPYTVTVPGVFELVRNSVTATAAASPTGPWALCWSPWKSRLVPRSASYSTMTPRFGPGVPLRKRATKAVLRPAAPGSTSKRSEEHTSELQSLAYLV